MKFLLRTGVEAGEGAVANVGTEALVLGSQQKIGEFNWGSTVGFGLFGGAAGAKLGDAFGAGMKATVKNELAPGNSLGEKIFEKGFFLEGEPQAVYFQTGFFRTK